VISTEYKQRHWVVYEIQLPYCTVCTSNQADNSLWYTPLTCEESSDDTYSIYLTENGAPMMVQPSPSISGQSRLNSSIFQCVDSGSESTPMLKAGRGLASRSTMSISCSDFEGDPGPINFSDTGTFFGKLLARNILEGKKIISNYYTKDKTQETPILVQTSEHYITAANLFNGTFNLSAKDALKDLEDLGQKYPIPTNAELTADINDTATTINYTGADTVSVSDIVRIGKELMRVTATGTGSFTVATRGNDIVDGPNVLSTTINTSHSTGDAIQICRTAADLIYNVFADIFDVAGLSAFKNVPQWTDEVDAWNTGASIYTVFHEPESCTDLLNRLLSEYMLDMWLDQSTQKALLSSVSAWETSDREIIEGNDFSNYRAVSKNDDRYSRAFVKTGKKNKTDNDDLTNFNQIAIYTDQQTESSDFYGDVKVSDFGASSTLENSDAIIWVKRFVDRFSTPPKTINLNMEERKLAGTSLGDVVDIRSRDKQSPSGDTSSVVERAQIVRIKPNLNQVGRNYEITAISYIPEDLSTVLIFDEDRLTTIDIHAELGAPGVPVDVTVILDGAEFGSSTSGQPTIKAGNLAVGSTVKIFCINDAIISSKGGDGGNAEITSSNIVSSFDGTNGGDIYESSGILTEIYVNWTSVGGYTASSQFRAPGGGGGGAATYTTLTNTDQYPFASPEQIAFSIGGSGGQGLPVGIAGTYINDATFTGSSFHKDGSDGNDGGFFDGGAAVTESKSIDMLGPTKIADPTTTSGKGGDYGFSGGDAVHDNNPEPFPNPPLFSNNNSLSVKGDAGYAITGGNVTVYNLAAESYKFKEGSSTEGVEYTLVDA